MKTTKNTLNPEEQKRLKCRVSGTFTLEEMQARAEKTETETILRVIKDKTE